MADLFERFMARAAMPLLCLLMMGMLVMGAILVLRSTGDVNIWICAMNCPPVQNYSPSYAYAGFLLWNVVLAVLVSFVRLEKYGSNPNFSPWS
jgi:hypothetical protein